MEQISDVPGPALATLTHDRFSDQEWIFERKLDGVRCLAHRAGGQVRLRSRTGGEMRSAFPEIAVALEEQATPDFVVDGEIVAFDGAQTSFARLQPRIHLGDPRRARQTGIAVFYYLFDVLHIDGHSTRGLPLRERKALLRELFDWHDPLRFSTHRNGRGEEFFADACAKGWEGLIAKRASSTYTSGRTKDWLKFKCERGQEFVIGGWTDPQGSRVGFGALLLGYYAPDGDFVYAGKVGTGFDHAMLRELAARMKRLHRESPPYADRATLPRKDVHWIEPELVGQVSFTEWTRDGQLRHPRFLGLRVDKQARDVVREE